MKRSWALQLIVIVMLVLSFLVTPVTAQSDPQVGTVDEDSDLVVEVLPSSTIGSARMPDINASIVDPLPDAEGSTDALVSVDSTPVSPGGFSYVMDKTPTFTFSRDVSATKYQIEVYSAISGLFIYTAKGSGDCTLIQCSITPTTKLKNYEIDYTQGFYSWRVRSFNGVSWNNYSGYDYFYVFSSGFNSTFDSHAKKWISVTGDWFRVDTGYLKSKGFTDLFASAIQKEFITDDYVYTARMKGKGGVDQIQGVIIGGYPTPTWDQNNWYDGVYFLYRNDKAGLLIIRNGTQSLWTGWTTQSALDPTGWNILEVTVNAPNAILKINGQTSWGLYNASADVESGYVGLAHFRDTPVKNPLLVDWAKLVYLPTGSAEGVAPDLNGAMVIDLNDPSQYPSQSGSPFDPPE